jgi:hypothetical protein
MHEYVNFKQDVFLIHDFSSDGKPRPWAKKLLYHINKFVAVDTVSIRTLQVYIGGCHNDNFDENLRLLSAGQSQTWIFLRS